MNSKNVYEVIDAYLKENGIELIDLKRNKRKLKNLF